MTLHKSDDSATAAELLRVLWRALPLLFRAAPGLVALLTLTLTVQGLTPALGVLIGKWTVDGVQRLMAGGAANPWLLAGAWALVAVLAQLTSVAATVLQGHVSDRFTVDTVRRLLGKLEELPGLDVVEDPRFHDDMELLSTGARSRPLNLTATGVWLLRDAVSAAGLAGTLLLIGWWVPLAVVAGLLPLARTHLKLREAGWSLTILRTQEARELALDQRVATQHAYAKEVRLYGLLPWLTARYTGRAERYARGLRGVRNRQVLGVLPAHGLALAVSAGLFAYAVWRASLGALTAGGVLLVVQSLAQLRDGLTSMTDAFGVGSEHLRWFDKYFCFLDAVPRVAAPAVPAPLPERLDLTLDGVSFAYPDGRAALRDLTLHIPEGQTVAVVGENGAGKSTLVRLLLRFSDPTGGQVRVGGADLRTLDPQAWRSQVAAVFQDFARFEYTLRENIELAHPRADTKLNLALAGSGFGTIVDALPNGLDTRLGVAFGGTELSGGQWQKLATARALYRQARVLILDEPTAALDPRAEHAVFEQFAALARGRTTLLITHRLASVRMADRIVVLQAGRLVEDGCHAELLARGGEYAELWRLQAAQYDGVRAG